MIFFYKWHLWAFNAWGCQWNAHVEVKEHGMSRIMLPTFFWTVASIDQHQLHFRWKKKTVLASWKNIRLCDLLKLSADVRNLKGNGRLLLKEKYCLNKFTRFAHCLRTLLGSPQRCLPILHSRTVAKTASQQENQIDEKEICDIWNHLHHVSTRLLSQNVCFIYLRVDLASVSFSCTTIQMRARFRPDCAQGCVTWQLTDAALTFCSWPCGSSPGETTVVCIRPLGVRTMWERNKTPEPQRVEQIRG